MGLTRLNNHRDAPPGYEYRQKGYQRIGDTFLPLYGLVPTDKGQRNDGDGDEGGSSTVTKAAGVPSGGRSADADAHTDRMDLRHEMLETAMETAYGKATVDATDRKQER